MLDVEARNDCKGFRFSPVSSKRLFPYASQSSLVVVSISWYVFLLFAVAADVDVAVVAVVDVAGVLVEGEIELSLPFMICGCVGLVQLVLNNHLVSKASQLVSAFQRCYGE